MNYPIFRDELYYIDCANHPAFGYVDHPPLSIFILMVWKAIFGDSQLSIRIIPSIAGAMLIFISSLITKEINTAEGSKILKLAPAFSSITVFSSLYFLATGGFYSMNVFDSVFWSLLFLMLIKIINKSRTLSGAEGSLIMGVNKNEGNSPSAQLRAEWLFFGIIAGLGMMNKISVGYLGFGIITAILLTKNRIWLKNKNIWLGGFIAAAIFSPYIIWNLLNDNATIEFIQNASKYKIAAFAPLDFFKEQILLSNPLSFPVWIAGLAALLFGKLKKFRIVGLTYIIILVLLTVMRAKPYYLAAAYPVLIAAGSVSICLFVSRFRYGNYSVYFYTVLLVVSTALLSPMVIPVLQPGDASEYIKKTGLMPSSGETSRQGELPQILADRFGWEEMTQKAAKIYNMLPDEEKKHTAIFTQNYGEAGAINYYGKKYGLQGAISGHNNHWLWGYGYDSITTLIIIGGNVDKARVLFNEVNEVERTHSNFAIPYENDLPIYLARGFKMPMKEIWKSVKKYI